jgi:hypothetical protein
MEVSNQFIDPSALLLEKHYVLPFDRKVGGLQTCLDAVLEC